MIKLYTGNVYDDVQDTSYTHPLLQFLFQGFKKLTPLYELNDSLENADIAILPLAVEYFQTRDQKEYLKLFISSALENNKPVWLFSTGDFGTTIKRKNVFTLRLGGFESKLDGQTEIMCPFFEDPLLFLNKEFKVLSKTASPRIGFVGHANGGVLKFIKEFVLFVKGNAIRVIGNDSTDYQHFYPSSYYRQFYLKRIQSNREIVANFIFRKKYRAGVVTEEDKRVTSIAFYANIFENQYVFCMRGNGNFSVRFYETLAMGRIPVMINTDCRLPFDYIINWKEHCLIIEKHEIGIVVEKIKEFHNALTDAQFELLQQRNRLLWQDYFTKDSYFVHYAKIIQEQCLTDRDDKKNKK